MEKSGLCSWLDAQWPGRSQGTFTAQPLRGGLGGNKHLAGSKDEVSQSLSSCILYPGGEGGWWWCSPPLLGDEHFNISMQISMNIYWDISINICIKISLFERKIFQNNI